LIRIADECLNAISQQRSDSATSENAEHTICPPSTSSAEDSPARTSATPESEPGLTESAAACGPNMRESFANYDPATSSWRTSQLCLDGEWSEFSETWPRSGMTRSGKAYELPTLARRTEENEFGLLPTPRAIYGEHPGMTDKGHLTGAIHFWPTPTAEDSQCKGNHPGAVDSLHAAVKMWPTPKAGDADFAFPRTSGRPIEKVTHLATAARYWPTPRASAAMANGKAGRPDSDCRLEDVVMNVEKFTTPQARDFRSGQCKRFSDPKRTKNLNDQIGGQLNPTWVEWLMGYPLEWTALEDSATPSSRKSRNGSEGE
jgi:hypothetical protein